MHAADEGEIGGSFEERALDGDDAVVVWRQSHGVPAPVRASGGEHADFDVELLGWVGGESVDDAPWAGDKLRCTGSGEVQQAEPFVEQGFVRTLVGCAKCHESMDARIPVDFEGCSCDESTHAEADEMDVGGCFERPDDRRKGSGVRGDVGLEARVSEGVDVVACGSNVLGHDIHAVTRADEPMDEDDGLALPWSQPEFAADLVEAIFASVEVTRRVLEVVGAE